MDSFFAGLHLNYLEHTCWRTRYSLSFPRLRPHAGSFHEPGVAMGDRELAQAICAFRLFNNEVEISLSTRESPRFRDNAMSFGVTTMSAGAKTNPGGYAEALAGKTRLERSLEQFHASDERSPGEITAMLHERGYEPVWKDWDASYDYAAATLVAARHLNMPA